MRSKLLVTLIVSSMLLGVTPVFADGGDPCADDCPSGQVKTSYLDGHQVSCACMEPGSGMSDDSATVYGGEGDQDPNNPS